jgi:hypothetical protein
MHSDSPGSPWRNTSVRRPTKLTSRHASAIGSRCHTGTVANRLIFCKKAMRSISVRRAEGALLASSSSSSSPLSVDTTLSHGSLKAPCPTCRCRAVESAAYSRERIRLRPARTTATNAFSLSLTSSSLAISRPGLAIGARDG